MNKQKTRLLGLGLASILVLSSCSDKEDNQTPDISTAPDVAITNPNVNVSKVYELSNDKIEQAIVKIPDMKDAFNIEKLSYRYIEKSDSTYETVRTETVHCLSNGTSLPVEVEYYISMEYRSNNNYPTSISINYYYEDSKYNDIMSNWTYSIVGAILNDNISNSLRSLVTGTTKDEIYTVDNLKFNISKYNEKVAENNNMASYAISITNTDSLIEAIQLDDFNASDNPKFGLFNTPIFGYNETLSYLESKMGEIFKTNGQASTRLISDFNSLTQDIERNIAIGIWDITDSTNNSTYCSLSVTEDTHDGVILNHTINTLPVEDKLVAFYNIEDILKSIINSTVNLEDYYNTDEFSIIIDKPDEGEALGFPVELTFKNTESIIESKTLYDISVNIATVTDSGMEPEIDGGTADEAQ